MSAAVVDDITKRAVNVLDLMNPFFAVTDQFKLTIKRTAGSPATRPPDLRYFLRFHRRTLRGVGAWYIVCRLCFTSDKCLLLFNTGSTICEDYFCTGTQGLQ